MRFPRNTKIFRGQLDPAPFIGVFFLLLIFVLFNSSLVFTPGVRIELPEASDLPGTLNPTVMVAVDASGQTYFENQAVNEQQLKERLQQAVQKYEIPITLVVQADKAATVAELIRLKSLAREAGIYEVIEATRPPVFGAPQSNPDSP
jgi:biopolymer transport protein ExbD